MSKSGKILLDLEQLLTSDTSLTLEELFLKRADQDFLGREAALLVTKLQ